MHLKLTLCTLFILANGTIECKDVESSGEKVYPKTFPPISRVEALKEPLDSNRISIMHDLESVVHKYDSRHNEAYKRQINYVSFVKGVTDKKCVSKPGSFNAFDNASISLDRNQGTDDWYTPSLEEECNAEAKLSSKLTSKKHTKPKTVIESKVINNEGKENSVYDINEKHGKNVQLSCKPEATQLAVTSGPSGTMIEHIYSGEAVGQNVDVKNKLREVEKMEKPVIDSGAIFAAQCNIGSTEKSCIPDTAHHQIQSNQVGIVSDAKVYSECQSEKNERAATCIDTLKENGAVSRCHEEEKITTINDASTLKYDKVNHVPGSLKKTVNKEDACEFLGSCEEEAKEPDGHERASKYGSPKIIPSMKKEEGYIKKSKDPIEVYSQLSNQETRSLQGCETDLKMQGRHVAEIQKNGQCCVNVGDISISFVGNDGKQIMKDTPSPGYEQEIEQMRKKIQEMEQLESTTQVNKELMNELKKVCIEAYDLEVLAEQWKSKYEDTECSLMQAKKAEHEKEAERCSLLAEKNELKMALSKADENWGKIKEDLRKKDEKIALELEKITMLEGLLDEKNKAMEEMIVTNEEVINENVLQGGFEHLKAEGKEEMVIKERKMSRSRSILSCFFEPMKRSKNSRAGKMSKKKKMRLIIDDLDEEIIDLRNRLSDAHRSNIMLKLLKEEGDREREVYKNKIIADASMVEKLSNDLEKVQKDLQEESKSKQDLVAIFKTEREELSHRNEDYSKEIVSLKKELKKMAWDLKFESSYNKEMEGKIQSYLRFMEERKSKEKDKYEKLVKQFTVKFEEKENLLRGLKTELNAERKSNKELKEQCNGLKSELRTCSEKHDPLGLENWKDSLFPHIKIMIEGMKGDFLKALSEYGYGKSDNVALLLELGNLGRRISDLITSQRGLNARQPFEESERKDEQSISVEKCKLETSLAITEAKAAKMEKQIEELLVKYSDSEKENSILKNFKKDFDAEIKKLKQENERLIIKVNGNDKEVMSDDMESKIAQMQKENFELKASMQKKDMLIEASKHEIRLLEDAKREIVAEKYDLKEELKKLTEHGDEVKLRRKISHEECRHLEAKLRESLKTENDTVFNLKREIDDLEKKNSDMEREVLALNSNIDKMAKDFNATNQFTESDLLKEKLRKEVEDLQEKYDKVNGRLSNELMAKEKAETLLKEMEVEVKKLMVEKEGLASELETNALELNATVDEFNNLLMKNEELMMENKKCRENHANNDAKEFETKLSAKKAENLKLNDEIKVLQGQLKVKCQENEKALKDNEEHLEQGRREVIALKERLEEMSKKYRDANEKVKELEGKVRVDNDDFEERLMHAKSEIERLHIQSTDYKVKWEKREEKLKDLMTEIASLQAEKRELETIVSQGKKNISNIERKLELRIKKNQEREAVVEQTMMNFENEIKDLEEKIAALEEENDTLRAGVRMMAMEKDFIM